MSRPDRLVLVCGTGTEVGKTWVGAALLRHFRGQGLRVAARKLAQSFDVDSAGRPLGGPTDAEVLGRASGEPPEIVCHPFRWYHRAMAPPMAAEALGLPPFSVADLVDELVWPEHAADVGLVETAGGVRSPQAADGDVPELVRALRPDLVLLVADAGLGTINGVRMSLAALAPVLADDPALSFLVVLNRFDEHHDLHLRNRRWLSERDGTCLLALPGEDGALADAVIGTMNR